MSPAEAEKKAREIVGTSCCDRDTCSAIAAALLQAVEAEREACAEFCDAIANAAPLPKKYTGLAQIYGDVGEAAGRHAAKEIAAYIRSRGKNND